MAAIENYLSTYALDEAKKAVSESSYGVGGLLIDARNGNILKQLHNTVIARESAGEVSRLKDPTAHGERQLVDWYIENRENLKLPAPNEIVIMTTLDPCCMCTGSILSAGFKVIVAALDDQAGINWDNKNLFKPFEGKELAQIKSSFIYPKVDGNPARPGYGNIPGCFSAPYSFKKATVDTSLSVFIEGANKARGIIGDVIELKDTYDIAAMGVPQYIRDALQKEYPQALSYRAETPSLPDIKLACHMVKAAKEDYLNGGDGDAVAFLDCFGNLLMCKGGKKSLSPIRTAYMETIRAYQKVRYELSKTNKDALHYLCEPKFGYFIFVRGFDKGTQSFADMGAYGSTILGELNNPDNLQYVTPRIELDDLNRFISGMPPRYRNLIKPRRVLNKVFIEAVENGLRSAKIKIGEE